MRPGFRGREPQTTIEKPLQQALLLLFSPATQRLQDGFDQSPPLAHVVWLLQEPALDRILRSIRAG